MVKFAQRIGITHTDVPMRLAKCEFKHNNHSDMVVNNNQEDICNRPRE
jgi:hypothetical protein